MNVITNKSFYIFFLTNRFLHLVIFPVFKFFVLIGGVGIDRQVLPFTSPKENFLGDFCICFFKKVSLRAFIISFGKMIRVSIVI
jgi:hypothetical protein